MPTCTGSAGQAGEGLWLPPHSIFGPLPHLRHIHVAGHQPAGGTYQRCRKRVRHPSWRPRSPVIQPHNGPTVGATRQTHALRASSISVGLSFRCEGGAFFDHLQLFAKFVIAPDIVGSGRPPTASRLPAVGRLVVAGVAPFAGEGVPSRPPQGSPPGVESVSRFWCSLNNMCSSTWPR
jgi:hypothetical protein